MYEFQRGDLISALVIDGVLYEADGVTPIKSAVFVNGVLMREVPLDETRRQLAMRAATI